MKVRIRSRKSVLAVTTVAAVAGVFSFAQFTGTSAASAKSSDAQSKDDNEAGRNTKLLDQHKLILRSAKQVDLHNDTVRLPLHRGEFNGETVWFVLTEASDFGLAADLNVNYSAKLTNFGISCLTCVQTVTETSDPLLKFGEGTIHFQGSS